MNPTRFPRRPFACACILLSFRLQGYPVRFPADPSMPLQGKGLPRGAILEAIRNTLPADLIRVGPAFCGASSGQSGRCSLRCSLRRSFSRACGFRRRPAARFSASLGRRCLGLSRQRRLTCGFARFTLQRALRRTRTSPRCLMFLLARSLILSRLPAHRRRSLRGRQFHARPPGLGQSNRNRLLRGPYAMFSFTNMMNFFSHEFSSLCGWRFPLARVFAGAFKRFLFGHGPSPFAADSQLLPA